MNQGGTLEIAAPMPRQSLENAQQTEQAPSAETPTPRKKAQQFDENVTYIVHENGVERRGFGTSYVTLGKPNKPFDCSKPETLAEPIFNLYNTAYWDWVVATYPAPPYVQCPRSYYRKPLLRYVQKKKREAKEENREEPQDRRR